MSFLHFCPIVVGVLLMILFICVCLLFVFVYLFVSQRSSSSSSAAAAAAASSHMNHRAAAMAFLSIITGYCMGLALVHAGTDHCGAKEVICGHISLLLKLRSGKFAKFQKSQQGSCVFDKSMNYSTGFIKACGDKASKILLEMFLPCLTLAAGVISSGSGSIIATTQYYVCLIIIVINMFRRC